MSNRRVVVTGTGSITALGTGTEKNWQAMLAGKSGIGPITRFDAEKLDTQLRRRGEGLRARAVHRQARSAPDGPVRPVRAGRRGHGREGERPAHRRGQAARLRRRSGWASSSARASAASPRWRSSTRRALEKGLRPAVALLHHPDDHQHGARAHLHPLRRQGPQLVPGVRLRHQRPRHRRGLEVHPPGRDATRSSPAAPRRPSPRWASAASR